MKIRLITLVCLGTILLGYQVNAGTILYERWTGITGTTVSSLTSNAAYPNNPSFTDQLASLEGPTDVMNDYGSRIRGYVHPPTTGNYTFWIAGDDNCQLWLSTSDSPAAAVQIAYHNDWTSVRQWTKFSSQQSASIALVAGQKYYIEVLHKEGGGGDNLAVAWQGPGITQQVISGTYLTPWVNNTTADLTIYVSGNSPIRTIPMTLYGTNLASWDGSMNGSNTTFNNLMKATGGKYYRIIGGSWSNGHLWSDIEEIYSPYNSATWKVSYNEYLNLLNALSVPGETIHPTFQPIVNFPGGWYGYSDPTPEDPDHYTTVLHGHQAAVDAAVGWVQDQTARATCAEYWEIGNEIGGPWEVGWFDGISGTYYGDYFADFYLAMKAVNPNIKIGACAEPKHELQPYGWYDGYWDQDLLLAAGLKGVIPDFFIIHSYQNGGGNGDASNNVNLLGSQINDIALWTSNMNNIVSNTLGSAYVGQIEYCMTEWNTSQYNPDPNSTLDNYDRPSCYVNAMFRAQYILEMAKNNWTVSNPWIYDYGSNYSVFPAWYVKPMLINFFGRNMVMTSDTHSLVRSYAAKDTAGNLTIFVVNNSPTASLTANVDISGFTAGTNGQRWLMEPAGSIIQNGITIQDKADISINGTVDPNPLTVSSLASQSFSSSNSFTVVLPASCMLLMKVPSGTGDITPPATPTGLSASINGIDINLDWNNNAETDLAGYHIYRSTTSGSGYVKLNDAAVVNSNYLDNTTAENTTYYYVVKAVDTSWNESNYSSEVSAATPVTNLGTILRESWIGISGTTIDNLTFNPDFPSSPFGVDQLTSLEDLTNWMDDYGTRIRGYLYPPATGNYTFWIAGNDQCELWLSTDGSPANAALIADVPGSTNSHEWTKYASQESSPIALTAGQKYYIEVLHKEGTGEDNMAVAWEGPGIAQNVISGRYLSPWFIGLYGDFDDSGTVSIDDLAEFAAMWLQGDCIQTSHMDLDGDCVINFYEFSQFAKNWN
jgi:hypothetical protein